LRAVLTAARDHAPSFYWVFVYGAMVESERECEEFATRWHAGRLNDLGFPNREQAMNAYRPLRVEATPVTDVGPPAAPAGALATTTMLPQRLAGTGVGRALSELPAERASEVLGYILAVANTLAVADGLALAESATVERSFRKAIRGIDRGLAELARANGLAPVVVLDQTPPLDLFRIGTTLDPEIARGKPIFDLDLDGDGEDWNVESELISDLDRALGPDGRPR